jgi:hypothetical protein
MRKKTEAQTRKRNKASSCEQSGLIAKNKKRRQSAGAESVLDNRSHRTFWAFTTPASRASREAGVPKGKAAQAAAA